MSICRMSALWEYVTQMWTHATLRPALRVGGLVTPVTLAQKPSFTKVWYYTHLIRHKENLNQVCLYHPQGQALSSTQPRLLGLADSADRLKKRDLKEDIGGQMRGQSNYPPPLEVVRFHIWGSCGCPSAWTFGLQRKQADPGPPFSPPLPGNTKHPSTWHLVTPPHHWSPWSWQQAARERPAKRAQARTIS